MVSMMVLTTNLSIQFLNLISLMLSTLVATKLEKEK